MSISKKTVAVALCAALGTTAWVAPARAGVVTSGASAKIDRSGAGDKWDPYLNAELRPDGFGQFTYVNPEVATVEPHTFELRSDVTVNGKKVQADWTAAPTASETSTADEVRYVQRVGDVYLTRIYQVSRGSVVQTVVAQNIGSGGAQVQVDTVNHLTNAPTLLAPLNRADAWLVEPATPGYATQATFSKATVHGVGATAAEARSGARGSDPRYQAGTWTKYLAPGEYLQATTLINLSTQAAAYDTDGDGLRDSWEAHGITLADGTQLPIQKWGASQTKPDLYLQLNWMKPEWETLGCDRDERFAATLNDFKKFYSCATASVKDHEPTPEILKELEDLFAENGIALHIDAGNVYHSPSLDKLGGYRGGKVLDYTREFFPGYKENPTGSQAIATSNDEIVTSVLQDRRNQLLKERTAVFRSGVIGDRISNQSGASGVSPVASRGNGWGGAFFVANYEEMTTQEQLRNTILHEFGHSLGLSHNGARGSGNTAPLVSNLQDYNSVMSYAHQWNLFNYTENDFDNGTYRIPSDWKNLNLPGNVVGTGSISVGREDEDTPGKENPASELRAPEEADAEELILAAAAAKKNQGKAGFTLTKSADGANGIVTERGGDNVLEGKLWNLGSTDDEFTVTANYGTGYHQQKVAMRGTTASPTTKKIAIPIDRAAFIDNPVVPVTVTVENKAGKQVFSDTFNVSALTYTEEEMKQVLDLVRNSNEDPALKAFAEQRLASVKETGRVTSTSTAPKPERKPAPAPSTSNTPEAPKKGSGSSDSPLAIVIGVLLGLLGLGAAAYGWAVQQGVVKAPF